MSRLPNVAHSLLWRCCTLNTEKPSFFLDYLPNGAHRTMNTQIENALKFNLFISASEKMEKCLFLNTTSACGSAERTQQCRRQMDTTIKLDHTVYESHSTSTTAANSHRRKHSPSHTNRPSTWNSKIKFLSDPC